MKKILLTLFGILFILMSSWAQAPKQINYQAVLRDTSGNILVNQSGTIEIIIKKETPTGTPVFIEFQNITTNAQGVFNIKIGNLNSLRMVNFGNGSKYFITTKLNGVEMGTMQMLSVPYALNASSLTLKSNDGKLYTASVTPSGKVVFHAAKSETTPQQKMLERLQEILDNLNMTKYTHTGDSIRDEVRGIYNYDCSGFICEFAVKGLLPAHYADLYTQYYNLHPADIRPRAWTFYDYFRSILGSSYDADVASTCTAQNSLWKVFTSIDSVQKGDLMIARYHDDWRTGWYANNHNGSVGSTGHVMTVWGPPVQVNDTINHPDYYKYNMLILDASSSGHGSDTRINSPSSLNGSGFGYGWMQFEVSSHASKRPYEYKWKPDSSSTYTLYNPSNTINDYTRLKGIIFARYIGDD